MPLYLSADGLPVGNPVGAPCSDEVKLCRLAAQLEQAHRPTVDRIGLAPGNIGVLNLTVLLLRPLVEFQQIDHRDRALARMDADISDLLWVRLPTFAQLFIPHSDLHRRLT